jgi:hypothetical protein
MHTLNAHAHTLNDPRRQPLCRCSQQTFAHLTCTPSTTCAPHAHTSMSQHMHAGCLECILDLYMHIGRLVQDALLQDTLHRVNTHQCAHKTLMAYLHDVSGDWRYSITLGLSAVDPFCCQCRWAKAFIGVLIGEYNRIVTSTCHI